MIISMIIIITIRIIIIIIIITIIIIIIINYYYYYYYCYYYFLITLTPELLVNKAGSELVKYSRGAFISLGRSVRCFNTIFGYISSRLRLTVSKSLIITDSKYLLSIDSMWSR